LTLDLDGTADDGALELGNTVLSFGIELTEYLDRCDEKAWDEGMRAGDANESGTGVLL